MYRYTLNSNKKFDCPECGQSNRFVRYFDNKSGSYIDEKYGRCDREESCCYHLKPPVEYINVTESKIKYKEPDLYDSDSLDSELYMVTYHYLKNFINPTYCKENLSNNVFINTLSNRFGIEKVRKAYQMYRLGMGFNGSTIFPYFFDDVLKSAKIIHFKNDLHRNKDISPLWLHSTKSFTYLDHITKKYDKILNNCYPVENEDYQEYINDPESFSKDCIIEPYHFCIPFFGWHIIEANKDKTICLVESEKTAVICSIVFPNFIWLASGGKNNIQQYKFNYYNGRKWLIFPDLSRDNTTLNKWKESIDKIKMKYSMFETFIDYLPPVNIDNKPFINQAIEKGFDIADFILDYNFKCNNLQYIDYMTELLKQYSNDELEVKIKHMGNIDFNKFQKVNTKSYQFENYYNEPEKEMFKEPEEHITFEEFKELEVRINNRKLNTNIKLDISDIEELLKYAKASKIYNEEVKRYIV